MTGGRVEVDMFPIPERPPRAMPRVMAHVADAGAEMIRFKCKCGWDSDWIPWSVAGVTNSTAKRGIPCPVCNEVKR